MNCEQAIEYIHSLEKFGIRPGLERVRELCRVLGDPQDKLSFIHVAGTNGKGSTSTIISNILIKAGYNVGLYISPYVTDFRERIQQNGRMIGENDLAECVESVEDAIEKDLNPRGIEITEFEALTAAAFLFFEKSKCDYVVLEVGLGGRFDATNIINDPLVSIIVSISLDHTAILGDTIEKIAFEKCGIIKPGRITVSYPFQSAEALDVIKNTCESSNNKLIIPDVGCLKVFSEEYDGTNAEYKGIKFKLPLAGKHMIFNTCTAAEAAIALRDYGIYVPDESISEGIEASVMPARLELIKKYPVILLDGGHNEGCAEAVSAYINSHFSGRRIVMVSSLMADKDYDSYLSLVASLAETFIASQASVPRALSSTELKKSAEKYCKNCIDISDPIKAIKTAWKMTDKNDIMIVCGSFYLAGEIRNELLNF